MAKRFTSAMGGKHIDGKQFSYQGSHKKKYAAEDHAQNLRGKGHNARIEEKSTSRGKEYWVFAR
jgi:hypothetical protein